MRPVDPLNEPAVAVIVVLPVATPVARPLFAIVTTDGEDELHNTVPETSCVLPSLNDPVATSCFVVPAGMLEFAGVTAIDTRVAPVTVSVAAPLTEPEAAVIVVVPVPKPEAKPELLTLATALADEFQATAVNSCVLPSSNNPVAVNCSTVPCAIDGLAGVSEIEIRCAATTVRSLSSLSVPTVAVIVHEPVANVEARPFASTLATEVSDELHVTPLFRSALDPSL